VRSLDAFERPFSSFFGSGAFRSYSDLPALQLVLCLVLKLMRRRVRMRGSFWDDTRGGDRDSVSLESAPMCSQLLIRERSRAPRGSVQL